MGSQGAARPAGVLKPKLSTLHPYFLPALYRPPSLSNFQDPLLQKHDTWRASRKILARRQTGAPDCMQYTTSHRSCHQSPWLPSVTVAVLTHTLAMLLQGRVCVRGECHASIAHLADFSRRIEQCSRWRSSNCDSHIRHAYHSRTGVPPTKPDLRPAPCLFTFLAFYRATPGLAAALTDSPVRSSIYHHARSAATASFRWPPSCHGWAVLERAPSQILT